MLCLIAIFGGLLLMMGQHSRAESLFYYFRIEDHVPENHNRAFRFGADALAMGFFSLFLACKTGEAWRGQPNILSPMASPIGGNLAST